MHIYYILTNLGYKVTVRVPSIWKKKKKKEFWNNFPNRIVVTEKAPRWSWEVWRMTVLLRIQDGETDPLVSGLLIPSGKVETMPSCCLLITSVCPVFHWNQIIPWFSGALLIPCRGQVCCFTFPWVGNEVCQVHTAACWWSWTEEGLLVLFVAFWVNFHCQESGSYCPLLCGVELTFLMGISPVWDSWTCR